MDRYRSRSPCMVMRYNTVRMPVVRTVKGNERRDQGISLLFVVLIGSILLITSVAAGGLALKMMQSASVRSGAVRAQYTAEAAFRCVVHWLQQENGIITYFSGSTPTPLPQCSDQTAIPVVYGGLQGNSDLYTFELVIDDNTINVQVLRDTTVTHFRGTTTVMGHDETGTVRELEKLQEYFFEWPAVLPADILFVVDRSGSIDGNRILGCNPNPADEWCQLKLGVTDAIDDLLQTGSDAQVGIVSYGTGIPDVGTTPEVGLTNDKNNLIPGGVLNMNIGTVITNNTNTSLGLAVAGAALMGKAYPSDGTFEHLVATNGSFSGLADISTGDRSDLDHPDYIILVTDGQPNGIVTHIAGSYSVCEPATGGVSCPALPGLHAYVAGETKVFPTFLSGSYEENRSADLVMDSGMSGATQGYDRCNDDPASPLPSTVWSSYGPGAPYTAMCNTELIVEKLKDEGIVIGVIGIGMNSSNPVYAEWLEQRIASQKDGEPMYIAVATFADFKKGLKMLIQQKLELSKLR